MHGLMQKREYIRRTTPKLSGAAGDANYKAESVHRVRLSEGLGGGVENWTIDSE